MTARIVSVSVVALVVLGACTVDATDAANPRRGPVGAIGETCSCANSQPECDAATGACQPGLVCTGHPTDGRQVCSQPCPCPLDFVCKAAGNLAGRLLCFRD